MAWPFKEKTEDEKDRANRKKEAKTKNIETKADKNKLKLKEREARAEERKKDAAAREAKNKTNDKLRSDGRPTHGISFGMWRRSGQKRDAKGRFVKNR